ncbi:MAG: hypothetical protein LH606_20150, partial [Cytophagaceae bacterium]|nr:hypothetical protein [Cytophagaceae bacterium]
LKPLNKPCRRYDVNFFTLKNSSTKYHILLGLTTLSFVMVEYYRPKPLDWHPTYSNQDAIPYGTKATFELLPELFNNQPIRPVRLPVYNHLRETNRPARTNYIFVNGSFEIDKNDLHQLLRYAAQGNQVFVAASQFAKIFQDTLNFRTSIDTERPGDSTNLNFLNPTLKAATPYAYRRNWANLYFKPDSLAKAVALGVNSRGRIDFIKIKFGKGAFLLHTVPVAFTNLYILQKPTAEYAFKAFSYLPIAPTYWDEYQKQGRIGDESIFRFLLSHSSLRWAYYLTLVTLLVYILLESKRRQRAIPVVEPPRNTSLDFVKTIGQLYFQQGNHVDLAEKKITHWLAYVRQQFNTPTNDFDEEFRQRLSAKSGVSRLEVDALLSRIEGIHRSGYIVESQLIDINQRIEAFYRQV